MATTELTTSEFLDAMRLVDELSRGYVPSGPLGLTPPALELLSTPPGMNVLSEWARTNGQIIEDLDVFRGLLGADHPVTQANVDSALAQLGLLMGDLNARLEAVASSPR